MPICARLHTGAAREQQLQKYRPQKAPKGRDAERYAADTARQARQEQAEAQKVTADGLIERRLAALLTAGAGNITRVRSLSAASDLDLEALGARPDDIAAFRAGLGQSDSAAQETATVLLARRDPASNAAQAAREQLRTNLEEQLRAAGVESMNYDGARLRLNTASGPVDVYSETELKEQLDRRQPSVESSQHDRVGSERANEPVTLPGVPQDGAAVPKDSVDDASGQTYPQDYVSSRASPIYSRLDSPNYRAPASVRHRISVACRSAAADFQSLGTTPKEIGPLEAKRRGLGRGVFIEVTADGQLIVCPAFAPPEIDQATLDAHK